ncbi:MAG: UxaA family hydrolase, partial [Chitinophagaceae bacterium]
MNPRVVKIHPNDNVIVALTDLPKGEEILLEGQSYRLQDTIPAKHKFFLQNMNAGDSVIMYGVLVGKVQEGVSSGTLMTTRNVHHATTGYAYRGKTYTWQPPDISRFAHRTFNGYHRSDGRVGTANYWLFIPMVFCENRNLDVIKEALQNELGYALSDKYRHFTRELIRAFQEGSPLTQARFEPALRNDHRRIFSNVDGIKFLNHQGGCGGTRQDAETLGRLLAAYADHPNVGGITLLSLGCQHLQTSDFLTYLKQRNPGFSKPL